MVTLFRRSVRYILPDGKIETHKLPAVGRFKPGAKINHLVMIRGHLFCLWFERVKGGWQQFKSRA